ncbi:uncharacterized protein LOC109848069 isoform X1 [Asparagus officinalis]|uniref:uncharacterized protein LOC109848069 isoform X1 n=1 Tax=Asparagus officinalis TaxID=4686 RepID=UPI00098E061C|nr:uncharacterized protein LOC109848069 isoform X1 [Asparagus officinalis]
MPHRYAMLSAIDNLADELFDGEEIMVIGFYNLMLDTKRKSRMPDDLGEVFNRVLKMMHQNEDCKPEQNITQENQDSQAEINEFSMTGLYKSKVHSENELALSTQPPLQLMTLLESTVPHRTKKPRVTSFCVRFELDMLVERVKATTRKLDGEIEKNPDGQNFIKLIKLESTTNFNRFNLRCLLNFYNCCVTKIMDSIREDPTTELQRIYEDMKHWAEVLLEQREEERKIYKDVFVENNPEMYNSGRVSLKH